MQTYKAVYKDAGLFKFLFLLPALFFLSIFLYYPIEETFRLSFMKSSGMGEDFFIGLDNYIRLFTDKEFHAGLIHVFTWAFFSIIIQIPLAFFIAYSLIGYKNRITSKLRAVYYLANVLPSAVTAMLGKFIFTPNTGVIDSLAVAFKWAWLDKIDFLGNPDLAFWAVFFVATWAYTGFNIIYLMANIEQIPKEIQESAMLDGANRWQYAFFFVLPLVKYPLRILMVLTTVGSIKLFDLPYMLTTGGPGYATVTLGITLYRQGFVNWQYGRASAIGVIILLLSLGFSIIQLTTGRKEDEA